MHRSSVPSWGMVWEGGQEERGGGKGGRGEKGGVKEGWEGLEKGAGGASVVASDCPDMH